MLLSAKRPALSVQGNHRWLPRLSMTATLPCRKRHPDKGLPQTARLFICARSVCYRTGQEQATPFFKASACVNGDCNTNQLPHDPKHYRRGHPKKRGRPDENRCCCSCCLDCYRCEPTRERSYDCCSTSRRAPPGHLLACTHCPMSSHQLSTTS